MPNGIPSHDTFRRVFLRLNLRKFQESFLLWMRSVAEMGTGEVVAVDGKAVRGARSPDGKEGLRLVSTWAAEQRLMLGQAATVERRYFISSLRADAKEALRAVRGHWQVENSLHWVLDVAFRENACWTRTGNAPENLATLRHIAVNLLKQERSCKPGVKSKWLKAGWDESYMLKVLNI